MDSLVVPSVPVPPRSARHEVVAQRYLTVRHVRHRADVEVCVAVGEIDLCTVSLVREALREIERRQVPRVLVDLSQVEFLSVTGVRVLAIAAERARSSGRQLGLVVATRAVRRVLELTGAFCGGLVTYDRLSDAMNALSVPDQPEMAVGR